MIIEREIEFELMNQCLNSVPQAGGRLVLVCGEAGIGKTAFIDQFLLHAGAKSKTAIAWCDPLNTPRPLGPIRDLSADLLGSNLTEFGEIDYFDGLLNFAQTSSQTLVLVIEDLHWVDQKTLDWLIFFGRRLSQLPILLVGSYRDDEIGPSHPLRMALATIPAARKTYVELPALSLEGVRRLGQHHSFSAEELYQITAGHPYFVTEILNSGSETIEPPQSVSDVVNARFSTLPEDLQTFLETVSCAAGDLPQAILQNLPFQNLTSLCDEAVARRILVPAGRNLKFRHELARLTVYARMGPGRKREAHAAFLAAHLSLKPLDQQLDMIVYHAEGAEDATATLIYAQHAASKAAMLGAHREAALYLGSALNCLDGAALEVAAEVNERWAYEAGLSLGIDDAVIAARKRAIAIWTEIKRPDRIGENLRWLSRMHWYRGEAAEAETYILQAIEIFENEAPSSETGKAYALRAQFLMLQENMVEAIKWAERAYAVAAEVEDFDTQAHALNTMGSARLFRGDIQGETELRKSLTIAHTHGLHEQAARVYTNLSECLIELRALDRAEVLLEEGIAFDTAHDLDAWTYYLIGRKAQLRFEQDHYSEAALIAQNVLEQPNQTLLMQMPARIILARANLRMEAADAEDVLAEALSNAEKIEEPQYLITLLIAQLELGVLKDDTDAAAVALKRLADMDATVFSPTKRGEYLFWAHQAQQPAEQSEVPVAFALFLAGDYGKAAQEFQAQGSNYLAGWSLAKLGTPEALEQADACFETCGAKAARQALRLGVNSLSALNDVQARGPYRAAREHPYALTAKEQIVLRMMVDGKTNTAIAEELSRSRRTIENHASAILSKLNCNNRLEVVLRSQSEPWILH